MKFNYKMAALGGLLVLVGSILLSLLINGEWPSYGLLPVAINIVLAALNAIVWGNMWAKKRR